MTVSLIAAASKNNVIGVNNELPWHMPNDMRYFKNTTWGMPVIMGRKTFESMNNEPLSGRINVVVTSNTSYNADGAVVVNSFADALFVLKEADCKEVFVIGGGAMYKDTIDKAQRIYLTRIHTIVDGDTFFPEIDEEAWKISSKKDCKADEKHSFDYTFEIWERV